MQASYSCSEQSSICIHSFESPLIFPEASSANQIRHLPEPGVPIRAIIRCWLLSFPFSSLQMGSKPKSPDPVHRRLEFFLRQRLSLVGNPTWRARAKDPQRYDLYDPFAAIVYDPGPGHPGNAVLGIRLCFQSLVLDFGGVMKRLPQPRHGVEILVISRCSSIFRGLAAVSTV